MFTCGMRTRWRRVRASGTALYLCNVKPNVLDVLERAGHLDAVDRARIFETKDAALRAIYARLDSRVCATCAARVFTECAAALPDGTLRDPPRPPLTMSPP